ncbi:uncharacterized protein PAC_11162 [Phialocephala subalpina]|uniref:Uncharacterized protein n=1 Tax=Phialocephala subalpina TaxID=576137 RepID=A0A1L7X8D2_9HELO|nr:uncharacterized protein PAC_11162 [Phialocephala subalpina]
MIWKLYLPPGRRLIPLFMVQPYQDDEDCQRFQFMYCPIKGYSSHPLLTPVTDHVFHGAVGKALLQAMEDGVELPWVNDVKFLAAPSHELVDWHTHGWAGGEFTGFGQGGGMSSMVVFKSLKQLTAAPDLPRLKLGDGELLSKHQQELRGMKAALNQYKVTKNPLYDVPEFIYMDFTFIPEKIVTI